MRQRYNLRTQPFKVVSTTNKVPSSRTTKKPKLRQSAAINNSQNRRQSLRLTSIIKPTKPQPIIRETPPKWQKSRE